MADLAITAANVVHNSGEKIRGVAGATITAGQIVYYDADAGTWKLAIDTSLAAAGDKGLGIALNGAAAGQPLEIAGPGCDVSLGASAAGTTYAVSHTAGALAVDGDIVTAGRFKSIVALGKGTNKVRVIARAAEAALP